MAVYVMSDLHGDFERYKKMLEIINFSDDDTLYILGDVVDRGDAAVPILQDMMMRPNVIPLLGNHEYMAINCLKFLTEEVTDDSLKRFDAQLMQGILEWQAVGGEPTMQEFRRLSKEEREDIFDYFTEFSLYEEVTVGGADYILVHAGISNFAPERDMDDYGLHELIFERADYGRVYFKDKILVTGHTPTRLIGGPAVPDMIYKGNNHIAIDCGCGYGGRLGAICLDSLEEFYV